MFSRDMSKEYGTQGGGLYFAMGHGAGADKLTLAQIR